MASRPATIVGAGVLGSLRYDDDSQSWLIELGQFLAVYELASTQGAETNPQLRQAKLEASGAMDRILAGHGVPISFGTVSTHTSHELEKKISMLLDALKRVGSSSHVSLVLLSECAGILRQEPLACVDNTNSELAISFAKGRLNDVGMVAPELSLATETLWQILRSKPPHELTTPGVRLLLRELLKPLVILVASADPKDANHLRLAQQRRDLDQALQATRFRDSFTIRDMPSCRIRDISRGLDDHNADILLFAGHGSSNGLCFEDDSGRVEIVNKNALARLLEQQESLKLVILTSCYSQDQAQCIANAVGHVIGMEGALRDSDAIDFSREFFTALGYGRTFKESFNRATAAVQLRSSSQLKPHFLTSQSGSHIT
jgi:hypothetical protein